MEIALDPGLIIFARVNCFLSPYFFAFPETGGEKIIVTLERRCGICLSPSDQLVFTPNDFQVPIATNLAFRIAIMRMSQIPKNNGFNRALLWTMADYYEREVSNHRKLLEDAGLKVPKFPIQLVQRRPADTRPSIERGSTERRGANVRSNEFGRRRW